MRRPTRGLGFGVFSCLLAAGWLSAACAQSPGSGRQPGAATNGVGTKGPTVMGEQLGARIIADPQQGGMPVGVVAVPNTWRFESRVVWNYAYHSNPVALSLNAMNPANEEALFGYASPQFFDLRPVLVPGYMQFGQNYGGLVYAHPMPPVQTLAGFIQQVRNGSPRLQFVGSKELPDLPAALKLPPSPQQRGIGVKVTYELNGKPVEEEFYAVFYSIDIPYDGPQGRTWQTNWGLLSPHSFRAPLGTLDKRRPVFAAMAKSFRPNPAWQQRLAAINAYLADQFNQQIKAGYDSIAAAGRLSRQISANNDAMLSAIDRQLQASRAPSGSSGTRSAVEKFDDYIRGVDTVDDPYYGTSQHSYNEQYHWTDGYGNYRNSNSASYDPNQREVGDWQLMKPIR